MKHTLLFFAVLVLCASMPAQTPQGISHQAVIRDTQGELVTKANLGIRVSILQGSDGGEAIYVETHEPVSNENGLITYVIGQGTPVSGSFGDIDWSNGPYFLKTEADPEGGDNYTIEGTHQIFSVPYALQAKTVEIETDPSVPQGTQMGEMQYWNGTAWVTVAPGTEGQVLTFINGVPTWRTRVGTNDVYNPITGKTWMDRNLGASQAATSSTDDQAYGHLYQWGRAADGHQVRTSGTTITLSSSDTPGHGNFIIDHHDWRSPQNDNLWQGVSGINNPCPAGYRLPTESEWDAERQSWSSNNSAGAFASPLKLPVAGYRDDMMGMLDSVGSGGDYWSSTVDGVNSRGLRIESTYAEMVTPISQGRAGGGSVRCLKD